MGFEELRRLANEEQFDERDLELYDQPAERMVFPSDPEFIAIAYFDGARFDDAAIDRVMEEYADRFPDHVIHPRVISLGDLSHYPYLASPRAEKTLIARGYVCDLEDRKVPVANYETQYSKAHNDVVKAEAFVATELFAVLADRNQLPIIETDPDGADMGLPRHPLAPITGRDSRLDGELPDDVVDTWRGAFERQQRWRGDDRDPDGWHIFFNSEKQFRSFAMVECNGLLLGRRQVNADDTIHMAYAGTPASFERGGRGVINGPHWTNRDNKQIEKRLSHEITPASLGRHFDACHWPSLTGSGDDAVIPLMVLVWQSQVVASLRKVAWRVAANGSAAMVNNSLRAEGLAPALHGEEPRIPIGLNRLDPTPPHASFQETMWDTTNNYIQSLPNLDQRQAWAENATMTLSHRDLLIGALCGMRYDGIPPDERPDESYELAFWLGNLRRHGRATMQIGFWHAIEEYVDRDPLGDLLFSALSEQVWQVLIEAAQELEQLVPGGGHDTERTITVTYDWSEGPEPWSVNREGDTIVITGPLLYFPVNERADWARKAEFVRENGGFLAPAPR